jgi:hypothetical protein
VSAAHSGSARVSRAGFGVLAETNFGCTQLRKGKVSKPRYDSRIIGVMRALHLVVAMSTVCVSVLGSEIREFDIKTIEHLGNELTRVSQSPAKGATTPARKRAVQTAKAALQGKLFNVRYDYIVLDDPDGSGFLVYALGQGPRRGDVVIHGHFRVSVSADGTQAKRVDGLSHSVVIENKYIDPSPQGYHRVVFVTSQAVGTRPVETLVYASNLMNLRFAVATPPNGQVWFIENGKITKSSSKK